MQRPALPQDGLMAVHPDFPWSPIQFWPDLALRDEMCLPPLKRLLVAARSRRKRNLPVWVVWFGLLTDLSETDGPHLALLDELAKLATLTAPNRLNALGARAWLANQPNRPRMVAGGFWTDRCVPHLVRPFGIPINKRLGILQP